MNKKILERLVVNRELLYNIDEEFKAIVLKGGIKIHSFQEAQGISGMEGLDRKVYFFHNAIYYLPVIYLNNTNN